MNNLEIDAKLSDSVLNLNLIMDKLTSSHKKPKFSKNAKFENSEKYDFSSSEQIEHLKRDVQSLKTQLLVTENWNLTLQNDLKSYKTDYSNFQFSNFF